MNSLALFNQRTFNAMVPTNQTSAIPRTSAGLRLRQRDSMPVDRLPKLSLGGGSSRGIHNGHGQHKQSSPTAKTTPRPSGSHPPSRPIPLPRTHITRTASELQLREDMAVAEWREMCMFHRLVEGMKERQQAQHQQLTPCHQHAAYGDSQDSTPHLSSGKQQLPTTITPLESPIFIDDSNRSAHLVEVLRRASQLGDLTGTETTTTTFNSSNSSSSISATINSVKQQQQQAQLQGSGWPLKGLADSLSTTTPSYVHNDDDEGEDEGIFTLDL